jgi:hypothetical protein
MMCLADSAPTTCATTDNGPVAQRPWQRGGRRDNFVTDPLTGQTAELRHVQPVESNKEYVCPGCNQEIKVRTGHLVVVPLSAPDLRRHWHTPCFERARRHGHR